jgi:hypothetical protein
MARLVQVMWCSQDEGEAARGLGLAGGLKSLALVCGEVGENGGHSVSHSK